MLSWFFRFSKDEGGEAPRFVLPLSPIRASDGEPTKLLCTLTGKPIPTVTWFCGQREIRASRDFQPHFEPSTGVASLTIAEVYPDDEGVYRCRATNKFGTAECEAPLTVGDMVVVSHQELIRAPVVAQPLEPDRVKPGERKVMVIRFDGYPTPEVKWYLNGRELQQSDNILITTFKNESTLIISKVSKDLSGKFEARALNEGGEARASATLLVADDKPTYQPPKFTTALRPQIVPEGEATIMEVEVESVPEAVFSWKQHGTPIESTATVQIVSENNRSTLFIPESFVEHSGIFTVKAENPAGSVASTATLTVEHLLTPEEFTQPVVEREMQSVKVMDGEEVRLTCKINGVPMPRIKWYHDGQPVRENHGVRMTLSPNGEAVLHMAEVFPEDDGLYECKAVNPAGQACTSAVLTIERYEYVPDSESASITAGPSISTWDDVTGPSGSEDDLLSDKPAVRAPVKKEKKVLVTQESKDEEVVNKDTGSAPRFVALLPQQMTFKDGQQARFEVKIESFPKAVVSWYLNGKELIPSKEFGVDHLEDGTSILTMAEIFPDDSGELMCEAQNDKGISTSITQIDTTDYKDTKEYRKPEWVTKMEVIRAKMAESEQPPQFTKELFDARVQETETATFEAFFAGNPKPDISWFYNGKLIHPVPNIKIRVKDGYTSCTLTEVTEEMAGEYSCKAITTNNTVVTKANLVVSELTGPAREAWLEKKAAMKAAEEKAKKEAEKLKRRGKMTKEEYLLEKEKKKQKKAAREAAEKEAEEEAKKIKEAQALEAQVVAAKKEQIEKERKVREEQERIEKEQREKAEAELKLMKLKKAVVKREMTVDEKIDKFVAQQAIGLRALLEMSERESLHVTEVVAQDKAHEFQPDQAPFQEFVKIENMLRSGVTVDQIVTMSAAGNLPVLTAPESQTALVRLVEDQGFHAVVRQAIVKEATRLAPEEPIGLKAVLKAVELNTANIQEIVEMAVNPQEFNIEAAPMPEIATVSTLLNEGISCEEMLTIVKAGELPALQMPETQWPLVQIMDKLGQEALVTQVIVEEPALNQAEVGESPKTVEEKLETFVTNQAIGLRALVEVAAQQSVSVTEVAPVEKIQEILPEAPIEEFGKVDTMLKAGVGVDQIIALATTSPLTVLTAPETQKALVRIVEEHGHQAVAREVIVKEAAKLAPEEPIGLKAVLKAVETKTANIRDITEMATHPEEFDLTSEPVPEMATVSACLHEGVSCEDVLTMVKAGELPTLKQPETQWPLVQIIERLGQTALVSQVIAEEPTLGLVGEMPCEEYSTESMTDMLSTATIQQAETMVLPDEPAPEFVVKIRDLEIKERQQVAFEAEVSADAAQVTWHKDGEPIKEDATGRYAFVADGRKRQLVIKSVSLLDEGEYTCSLGENECTAELTVIELPPEITLQLKDVTVKRGEEATFEIELTKGDAKIQWFRDEQEVELSEHIQLAIDGKRQRLVIVDCGPDDAKEYTCRIGGQKSSARLTVLAPDVDFTARLPEVTAATMGQDVTFTVVLSKEADVWWIKNGEAVAESDRIKMTKDGLKRSLTISKAVIEDSAEYTCILDTLKCSTVLTVDIPRVPPSIAHDQIQTEVWVKRGEDCVVDIPYNGFPTPKSEWMFKGKAIRKTKRSTYTITESSAQLTLRGVEENEAGAYTCKLINDVGEASVTVTVKLVGKPESPSAPECLETADDSITIMWKPPVFNGGSEIINYIIEYQEKNTKKWVVANKSVTVIETTYMVTKLTYNSEYRFRVTAVNAAGPGSPSSESLVFKAAKPANPEAPTVKEPLKDTTSGLKQSVTLSCIIVGVPTPTLTWYKDHTPFKPTTVSYEAGCARLTLSNTTEEDAGHYTLEATNDSGSVETSCNLVIQESPKIVPEKKAKVYKTKVEKQWAVTAKVGGLPRPDVVWTKNGASIEGDTHYIANTEILASTVCSTTLTIINTERTDTAKYTLTATNAAGSATYDVTLKVTDKPTKPQGPIVGKDIDKSSVTIEWKPPLDNGGIELKGYYVEFSEYLKEEWTKIEEVITTTLYQVQNLVEGNEYVFRVNATNDVGSSDWLVSDPILIKNQFDVPSAPRGPLEIYGMTDTTCFIKWVAPANNGGSPINEYLVERREVSKKAWQKVGTVDGNTTVIEAVALKKDTGYNFRISAQNQIGYGPPYTPEDVITVGKRITSPSQPTNLHAADITSRSVTLQWSPPVTTGGAELTGYIIEKRMEGTDKWEKVVTLDPSITLYCIQNLKEKSEYFFRVLTENPMGLSPAAETEKISLKTHATVPSPPAAPLEVRPVGPNAIIVEWGIPESDGGSPIDGYIIAVRESHKTMWMEVGQVDADTTRHIVKELQESHKYYVRVFARNEVGLSDPLETEEPIKVVRPPDYLDTGSSGSGRRDRTASCSTETLSSWMRENSMDADIKSYSTSSLLRRDEYFFRIWFYSKQLFK